MGDKPIALTSASPEMHVILNLPDWEMREMSPGYCTIPYKYLPPLGLDGPTLLDSHSDSLLCSQVPYL